MPDNTNHWTPDDAFWDEAWADMERRLNERRRRRPLLWLWWGGGAIAATLLTVWLLTDKPPPPQALAPETPKTEVNVVAADAPKADMAPPPDLVLSVEVGKEDGEMDRAHSVAPVRLRTVTAGSRTPVPTAAVEEPRRNFAAVASPIPTLQPAALTYALVLPVPSVEQDLPEKPFTAAAAPRFGLMAGTNTYMGSYHPGAWVELNYTVARGRWQPFVGLRYDYGVRDYAVTQDAGGSPAERLDDLYLDLLMADPNFGMASGAPLVGLSPDSDFRLRTHTLGLRLGLSRRIGGRLFVFGGGSLDRRLSSRHGLRESNQPVTPNPQRNSQSDRIDELFRTADWSAGLWLRGELWLANRWRIGLGYTRELTDPLPNELLSTQRDRVELGLRYGF